mmetsp:Transcript_27040/g.68138  ORF Transcript_27040/g.68138 Transcript_27040/m.68138 type:complete len:4035 (+) Transcript_27040:281-12385(+)
MPKTQHHPHASHSLRLRLATPWSLALYVEFGSDDDEEVDGPPPAQHAETTAGQEESDRPKKATAPVAGSYHLTIQYFKSHDYSVLRAFRTTTTKSFLLETDGASTATSDILLEDLEPATGYDVRYRLDRSDGDDQQPAATAPPPAAATEVEQYSEYLNFATVPPLRGPAQLQCVEAGRRCDRALLRWHAVECAWGAVDTFCLQYVEVADPGRLPANVGKLFADTNKNLREQVVNVKNVATGGAGGSSGAVFGPPELADVLARKATPAGDVPSIEEPPGATSCVKMPPSPSSQAQHQMVSAVSSGEEEQQLVYWWLEDLQPLKHYLVRVAALNPAVLPNANGAPAPTTSKRHLFSDPVLLQAGRVAPGVSHAVEVCRSHDEVLIAFSLTETCTDELPESFRVKLKGVTVSQLPAASSVLAQKYPNPKAAAQTRDALLTRPDVIVSESAARELATEVRGLIAQHAGDTKAALRYGGGGSSSSCVGDPLRDEHVGGELHPDAVAPPARMNPIDLLHQNVEVDPASPYPSSKTKSAPGSRRGSEVVDQADHHDHGSSIGAHVMAFQMSPFPAFQMARQMSPHIFVGNEVEDALSEPRAARLDGVLTKLDAPRPNAAQVASDERLRETVSADFFKYAIRVPLRERDNRVEEPSSGKTGGAPGDGQAAPEGVVALTTQPQSVWAPVGGGPLPSRERTKNQPPDLATGSSNEDGPDDTDELPVPASLPSAVDQFSPSHLGEVVRPPAGLLTGNIKNASTAASANQPEHEQPHEEDQDLSVSPSELFPLDTIRATIQLSCTSGKGENKLDTVDLEIGSHDPPCIERPEDVVASTTHDTVFFDLWVPDTTAETADLCPVLPKSLGVKDVLIRRETEAAGYFGKHRNWSALQKMQVDPAFRKNQAGCKNHVGARGGGPQSVGDRDEFLVRHTQQAVGPAQMTKNFYQQRIHPGTTAVDFSTASISRTTSSGSAARLRLTNFDETDVMLRFDDDADDEKTAGALENKSNAGALVLDGRAGGGDNYGTTSSQQTAQMTPARRRKLQWQRRLRVKRFVKVRGSVSGDLLPETQYVFQIALRTHGNCVGRYQQIEVRTKKIAPSMEKTLVSVFERNRQSLVLKWENPTFDREDLVEAHLGLNKITGYQLRHKKKGDANWCPGVRKIAVPTELVLPEGAAAVSGPGAAPVLDHVDEYDNHRGRGGGGPLSLDVDGGSRREERGGRGRAGSGRRAADRRSPEQLELPLDHDDHDSGASGSSSEQEEELQQRAPQRKRAGHKRQPGATNKSRRRGRSISKSGAQSYSYSNLHLVSNLGSCSTVQPCSSFQSFGTPTSATTGGGQLLTSASGGGVGNPALQVETLTLEGGSTNTTITVTPQSSKPGRGGAARAPSKSPTKLSSRGHIVAAPLVGSKTATSSVGSSEPSLRDIHAAAGGDQDQDVIVQPSYLLLQDQHGALSPSDHEVRRRSRRRDRSAEKSREPPSATSTDAASASSFDARVEEEEQGIADPGSVSSPVQLSRALQLHYRGTAAAPVPQSPSLVPDQLLEAGSTLVNLLPGGGKVGKKTEGSASTSAQHHADAPGAQRQPPKKQTAVPASQTASASNFHPHSISEDPISNELLFRRRNLIGGSGSGATKNVQPYIVSEVENLNPGTSYVFEIAAVTERGVGAYSNSFTFSTLGPAPDVSKPKTAVVRPNRVLLSTELLLQDDDDNFRLLADLSTFSVRYYETGLLNGGWNEQEVKQWFLLVEDEEGRGDQHEHISGRKPLVLNMCMQTRGFGPVTNVVGNGSAAPVVDTTSSSSSRRRSEPGDVVLREHLQRAMFNTVDDSTTTTNEDVLNDEHEYESLDARPGSGGVVQQQQDFYDSLLGPRMGRAVDGAAHHELRKSRNLRVYLEVGNLQPDRRYIFQLCTRTHCGLGKWSPDSDVVPTFRMTPTATRPQLLDTSVAGMRRLIAFHDGCVHEWRERQGKAAVEANLRRRDEHYTHATSGSGAGANIIGAGRQGVDDQGSPSRGHIKNNSPRQHKDRSHGGFFGGGAVLSFQSGQTVVHEASVPDLFTGTSSSSSAPPCEKNLHVDYRGPGGKKALTQQVEHHQPGSASSAHADAALELARSVVAEMAVLPYWVPDVNSRWSELAVVYNGGTEYRPAPESFDERYVAHTGAAGGSGGTTTSSRVVMPNSPLVFPPDSSSTSASSTARGLRAGNAAARPGTSPGLVNVKGSEGLLTPTTSGAAAGVVPPGGTNVPNSCALPLFTDTTIGLSWRCPVLKPGSHSADLVRDEGLLSAQAAGGRRGNLGDLLGIGPGAFTRGADGTNFMMSGGTSGPGASGGSRPPGGVLGGAAGTTSAGGAASDASSFYSVDGVPVFYEVRYKQVDPDTLKDLSPWKHVRCTANHVAGSTETLLDMSEGELVAVLGSAGSTGESGGDGGGTTAPGGAAKSTGAGASGGLAPGDVGQSGGNSTVGGSTTSATTAAPLTAAESAAKNNKLLVDSILRAWSPDAQQWGRSLRERLRSMRACVMQQESGDSAAQSQEQGEDQLQQLQLESLERHYRELQSGVLKNDRPPLESTVDLSHGAEYVHQVSQHATLQSCLRRVLRGYELTDENLGRYGEATAVLIPELQPGLVYAFQIRPVTHFQLAQLWQKNSKLFLQEAAKLAAQTLAFISSGGGVVPSRGATTAQQVAGELAITSDQSPADVVVVPGRLNSPNKVLAGSFRSSPPLMLPLGTTTTASPAPAPPRHQLGATTLAQLSNSFLLDKHFSEQSPLIGTLRHGPDIRKIQVTETTTTSATFCWCAAELQPVVFGKDLQLQGFEVQHFMKRHDKVIEHSVSTAYIDGKMCVFQTRILDNGIARVNRVRQEMEEEDLRSSPDRAHRDLARGDSSSGRGGAVEMTTPPDSDSEDPSGRINNVHGSALWTTSSAGGGILDTSARSPVLRPAYKGSPFSPKSHNHQVESFFRRTEEQSPPFLATMVYGKLEILNLESATDYFIKIRAQTRAGFGPWSEEKAVKTTLALPPPNAPSLIFAQETQLTVVVLLHGEEQEQKFRYWDIRIHNLSNKLPPGQPPRIEYRLLDNSIRRHAPRRCLIQIDNLLPGGNFQVQVRGIAADSLTKSSWSEKSEVMKTLEVEDEEDLHLHAAYLSTGTRGPVSRGRRRAGSQFAGEVGGAGAADQHGSLVLPDHLAQDRLGTDQLPSPRLSDSTRVRLDPGGEADFLTEEKLKLLNSQAKNPHDVSAMSGESSKQLQQALENILNFVITRALKGVTLASVEYRPVSVEARAHAQMHGGAEEAVRYLIDQAERYGNGDEDDESDPPGGGRGGLFGKVGGYMGRYADNTQQLMDFLVGLIPFVGVPGVFLKDMFFRVRNCALIAELYGVDTVNDLEAQAMILTCLIPGQNIENIHRKNQSLEGGGAANYPRASVLGGAGGGAASGGGGNYADDRSPRVNVTGGAGGPSLGQLADDPSAVEDSSYDERGYYSADRYGNVAMSPGASAHQPDLLPGAGGGGALLGASGRSSALHQERTSPRAVGGMMGHGYNFYAGGSTRTGGGAGGPPGGGEMMGGPEITNLSEMVDVHDLKDITRAVAKAVVKEAVILASGVPKFARLIDIVADLISYKPLYGNKHTAGGSSASAPSEQQASPEALAASIFKPQPRSEQIPYLAGCLFLWLLPIAMSAARFVYTRILPIFQIAILSQQDVTVGLVASMLALGWATSLPLLFNAQALRDWATQALASLPAFVVFGVHAALPGIGTFLGARDILTPLVDNTRTNSQTLVILGSCSILAQYSRWCEDVERASMLDELPPPKWAQYKANATRLRQALYRSLLVVFCWEEGVCRVLALESRMKVISAPGTSLLNYQTIYFFLGLIAAQAQEHLMDSLTKRTVLLRLLGAKTAIYGGVLALCSGVFAMFNLGATVNFLTNVSPTPQQCILILELRRIGVFAGFAPLVWGFAKILLQSNMGEVAVLFALVTGVAAGVQLVRFYFLEERLHYRTIYSSYRILLLFPHTSSSARSRAEQAMELAMRRTAVTSAKGASGFVAKSLVRQMWNFGSYYLLGNRK